MRWAAAEADVGSALAEHPDRLASLARAEIPAIALRRAYPAARGVFDSHTTL